MDLRHKENWSIGTRLMKQLRCEEGLLVPRKRVMRRRIGTGENGIIGRRATRRNEVTVMDFVQDRMAYGRPFRLLVVLSKHTRECLAIELRRTFRGKEIAAARDELTALCGARRAARAR